MFASCRACARSMVAILSFNQYRAWRSVRDIRGARGVTITSVRARKGISGVADGRDMADNSGMTDRELIQAYEAAKREAEGWSDVTDGSADFMYWHKVAPLENQLRARGLMPADGQGPQDAMENGYYAAMDMAGMPNGYAKPRPLSASDVAKEMYAAGDSDFDKAAERYGVSADDVRREMAGIMSGVKEAGDRAAANVYDERMNAEVARYNAAHPRTPYKVKDGQYVREQAPLGPYGEMKAAFGRKLDTAQRWLDENVWKTRPKTVKADASAERKAAESDYYRKNVAMGLAGLPTPTKPTVGYQGDWSQSPKAEKAMASNTARTDNVAKETGKTPMDLATGKPVGGFAQTVGTAQKPKFNTKANQGGSASTMIPKKGLPKASLTNSASYASGNNNVPKAPKIG